MNFKSMEIENFKSFGATPIKIDLDFQGKKLLVGANGSGKTSMFDALVWCIYGKTELRADNVVNKLTKENCKVEILFENGGKEYVITRYRKHKVHGNSVYLFEEGENITPRTASDTQALIEEIVGIDYRALSSSVVLSSETYKKFLRETGASRLSIFDSVFSLKEISSYGKITKSKIKSKRSSVVEIENRIATLDGSLNSLTDGLKSYLANSKKKEEAIKDDMSNLTLKIEKLKKEGEKLKSIDVKKEREKISKNQDIIQKTNFIKEQLNELPDTSSITIEVLKYSNLIDKLEREIAELSKIDIDKEEKSIEEFNKKSKIVAELNTILDGHKNKVKTLRVEASSISSTLNGFIKNRDEITKKIDEIKSHIDTCPECGSIIDEGKHKEILNRHDATLSELEEKISIIESELDDKNKQINNMSEIISSSEEKIPKLEEPKYTNTYLNSVSTTLAKNKSELENSKKWHESKEKELNDILNKKKILEENLSEYPEVENTISIEDLDEISKKIESNSTDIKISEASLLKLNENLKEVVDTSYVKKVLDTISDKKEEKKEEEKEKNNLLEDLKYLLALDEVFSNSEDGFKKYFIENSIDLFNENVNMYLPFFFEDEIKITFDKNLVEEIEFKGLPAEWNELSSGQKTRAELAVVFSLYMMVRALFGSGTNLLVLDEIIDQNLDLDGVNSVVNVLNNISSDGAVFIVSHRDDYKDNFQDVIKVEIDGNGFTKVS